MAADWQTMDTAPPTTRNQKWEKDNEFMVAHNGTWEPCCKLEDGILYYWGHVMYEVEQDWVPFDVSIDDPTLRWAPKPELPVF